MLCRGVSPGQVWGRPRCLRDAGDEDPPQFRGKKLPVVVLKSLFSARQALSTFLVRLLREGQNELKGGRPIGS